MMMRVGLVLYRSKWLLGEVVDGLPPAGPDAPPEPIVLRHPVEVLHHTIPVAGELEGSVGLMTIAQLATLPLDDAPLTIEWGSEANELAPPWRVLDVDVERPPADETLRRYLALVKPLLSAPADAGDGAAGGRRIRLS